MFMEWGDINKNLRCITAKYKGGDEKVFSPMKTPNKKRKRKKENSHLVIF